MNTQEIWEQRPLRRLHHVVSVVVFNLLYVSIFCSLLFWSCNPKTKYHHIILSKVIIIIMLRFQ